MTRLGCAGFLAAVAIAILPGCGDSEAETSGNRDTTAESAPAAEPNLAAESLVGLPDLPNGATIKGRLPAEPCGPLPILKKAGAQTAKSKLFDFSGEKMTEVVGIFPKEEPAKAAYAALSSRKRFECIAGALQGFNPEQSAITVLRPRSLDVGDEDSLVRFLVEGSESSSRSHVDIASIRSGRCVATLIFLVEGGTRAGAAPDVGRAAAKSLAGACG
jgi:hypothetical protein